MSDARPRVRVKMGAPETKGVLLASLRFGPPRAAATDALVLESHNLRNSMHSYTTECRQVYGLLGIT